MAVKLRLTRMGAKKRPTYRIVATDSRNPRDGQYLELVGTYSPVGEATTKINDILNKKLSQNITEDDITSILALSDSVAKKITQIPDLVKALGVAYENLRTEEETQLARGGGIVESSMNADEN